ncbi:radical SAM protein [Methanolobus sp. ZRKC3]|uniref:B12-binding domain-containing radical SAM protein n=1 Tax=Methanolobus sp. ZRKC3 TaxID=3125786 RepID=UPI00324B8229
MATHNNKYLLLNLPNPVNQNIYREFAGGFGTLGSLSSETLIPTYLLYGASGLRDMGADFEVLDAQGLMYDYETSLEVIDSSSPDVVITWLSLPSLYDDLDLVEKIKEKVGTVVVLGAIGNVMPEKVLEKADLVVKAGYPHYNAVKNIFKGIEEDDFAQIEGAFYYDENQILVQNPVKYEETVDNLWFDVYKEIPINSYLGDVEGIDKSFNCVPILTAVGCPYSCMYCPYPLGYGRKVVHKSVKQTVKEIKYLKENFGINGFVFRAQNFTYDHKWINEFCDTIIKENLNINWLAETRADLVSPELLQKMKSSGCFRIHYGVETTADELQKIGKPGLDINKIKETFKITRDLKIFTMAHMIIGLPGENNKTLDKTIQTIIELNPDAMSVNIATPYPGTKLFDIADNEKLIETYDFSKYTSFDSVMRTKNYSKKELLEAKKRMKREFIKNKILCDSSFRKRYLRSIPRKLKARMISFV